MTAPRRQTPFEVVAAAVTPAPATKRELVAEARRIEQTAGALHPHTVVATLQDVRFLTDRTRAVYTDLASGGARVTLIARDLPAYVAPGVRGVALTDDDPLVDVWSILLLGDSSGTVLAAADRYALDAADPDREFEVASSDALDVVRRCLHTLDPLLHTSDGE